MKGINMFGLGLFKKRVSPTSIAARKSVLGKVPQSQAQVLKTIAQIGPCHYRQVSAKLRVIEGCVTPRISELRSKGYVKVAFVAKGIGKTPVNHYRITAQGLAYLRRLEHYGE